MIANIKRFICNNKYTLISGACSLFIIMVVYFCYSIIPFGDKTIYRMDLYHQYGPLFSELYDRITTGESLLYSWNSGLGSPFIGNFFNYLSSPFSFLVLLFGHKNTFEAVAAMIAIKAVLSSMSLSYYLKKSQKSDSAVIVAFGVMYAFSAYFVAYYWNVMWIDAMYLLPLITHGIEKIINSGKCVNYIIFLSIAIFTNYYIGFMLCIFACLYFLYYYCCSFDNHKKTVDLSQNQNFISKIKNSYFFNSSIRFALSSFAVGLILLFMIIPVAYVLSSSSATSGNIPTEINNYFNIFDFLANHLAALEPTIRSSGEDVLPNVYCGILTIILVPLYLFSDKIRSTEKIASICLLAFMFFSFNINILNYIWHGLHFPNDLPYRQSFMYSFILICLAYKAFVNINEYSKKQILSIGISALFFVVVTQKLGSKNVDDITVFTSVIFITAFIIILGLIRSKKNQVYALTIILVCTVISETIVSNTDHYVANQTKTAYTEDYDDFKALQSEIDNKDKDLFYRVELSDLRARMDPSWYDYNGVSIFSSMAYEKVANLQKYIGLYGNQINSYTYNPQTPIYNSMFSLKYIYDKNSLISDEEYYKFIDNNVTYSVYENNYFLNIAFPVSNSVLDWDASSYSNPVDVQEELFRLSTGVEFVFNRIYDYEFNYNNIFDIDDESKYLCNFTMYKMNDNDPASLTANITANSDGHLYVYIYSRNLDDVNVASSVINTTMNVSDGYILDLGYYMENDLVSIELPINDEYTSANVDFIVFTVDEDKFKTGYDILKSGQMEYTSFSDTKIEGKFSADENEILFTSIPYDKGWSVYIDGEKVEKERIIQISDALLGIAVTSGEHSIKFEYTIPGMKIACIVSCIFILIILILFVLKKKKLLFFKNCNPNIWERTEPDIENTGLIVQKSDNYESDQDEFNDEGNSTNINLEESENSDITKE